jgi:hypothetical protein
MNKYFVFLCLFIFPLLGKSQTITDMSIDTATQDTAMVTSVEMIADTANSSVNISRQLYVNASRISGNYALIFSLQINTATQFLINPGCKIILKMADGSTAEMISNSLVPSQPGVVNNGQFIKISYPLPSGLFNKLLNVEVNSLSLAYDKGSFDFSLGTAYSATLKRICQLLK